jgi:hypothetical protein
MDLGFAAPAHRVLRIRGGDAVGRPTRSLLIRPANAGRKTTEFGLVFLLRLPITPAFLVIEIVL